MRVDWQKERKKAKHSSRSRSTRCRTSRPRSPAHVAGGGRRLEEASLPLLSTRGPQRLVWPPHGERSTGERSERARSRRRACGLGCAQQAAGGIWSTWGRAGPAGRGHPLGPAGEAVCASPSGLENSLPCPLVDTQPSKPAGSAGSPARISLGARRPARGEGRSDPACRGSPSLLLTESVGPAQPPLSVQQLLQGPLYVHAVPDPRHPQVDEVLLLQVGQVAAVDLVV